MKLTTVDRRKPLHELRRLFGGRGTRTSYMARHPELGTARLSRGKHGWRIINCGGWSGWWRTLAGVKAELAERGYTELIRTLE